MKIKVKIDPITGNYVYEGKLYEADGTEITGHEEWKADCEEDFELAEEYQPKK